MGLEETVSECSDKKQRILVVDGERLDPAILERLAVAEVKVPLLPSATRCTACGAKEGEPCRGNCERAIPSSIGRSEDAALAYKAFWERHALGSKVCPSCLLCGQQRPREEWDITHGELPDIYICRSCVSSARSATVEIDQRMLMLIRVLDDLEESGNGWNPATMPRSANEAERKFRDMLATNWKDIRRLIPIRASDGGVK
jgi:hypothetical protein